MTSVNITESSNIVYVTEEVGKTTVVTAPAQTVTVSTVGLGPQGPGGDLGLYANFIDTTDQPLISISASQVLTLNTALESRGISLVDGSKIRFDISGTYKILASLQITNSSNNTSEVNIFFKKNGNSISNSNTRIDLEPRKSVNTPYHACFTIEFQLDLVASDYIQIFWSAQALGITIDTIPLDDLHPQAPSAIINVAQVLFAQAGVPTGGSNGDLLVKKSSVNHDTAWSGNGAQDRQYLGWLASSQSWAPMSIPNNAPRSFTFMQPVAGNSFTLFRTNASITLSDVIALVSGTTPSVSYEIRYGSNRSTIGTVAASSTATNTTVGSSATIQNQPIPANNYVWLSIANTTGTVSEINLSFVF